MAYSQDNFHEQFEASFNAEDTTEQREILESWKLSNPKDPALYKCYFKYYVFKSQKKVSISKKKKGDKADQPENRSRSMFDETFVFEPNDANMALAIINKGITIFPTRLDMRWEKINVLLLMEDWDKYTQELITTIDYSKTINNKWTWTNDEAVEDAETNFLSSIHDYATKIYETENTDLYPNMRKISKRVIKYYPNHIDSYTYVAISYFYEKKYDKGINTLLKANEIKPNEGAILNNIAFLYETKGDNTNAIKYYKKLAKHGSKDEVKAAKKKIAKLSE